MSLQTLDPARLPAHIMRIMDGVAGGPPGRGKNAPPVIRPEPKP